jgi:hypothetical protein
VKALRRAHRLNRCHLHKLNVGPWIRFFRRRFARGEGESRSGESQCKLEAFKADYLTDKDALMLDFGRLNSHSHYDLAEVLSLEIGISKAPSLANISAAFLGSRNDEAVNSTSSSSGFSCVISFLPSRRGVSSWRLRCVVLCLSSLID